MTKRLSAGLSGIALVVGLAMSAPAYAQEADTAASDADGGGSQIGEIIVTAQKRSQKLTDVGATIAVAGSEQLDSAGISDIGQLARIVPGLTAATSQLGYPVYSIRGVNFNASQLSAPPAISVYLDEAPLPFSFMTAGMLYDVERVEVLKGPQGTLFGQNATGGSINVIAAKPTSVLSAGLKGEVNHFGQVMLEGYVSGPLGPTLNARLAATTTQFGAWQRGYYLSDQKNGDQNKAAGRLMLDWQPSDRLKVMLTAEGRYDHGEVQLAQLNAVLLRNPAGAPPGLVDTPLPNDPRDAETDMTDTHARNSFYQAIGRIDYELSDNLDLTSITSYIYAKYFSPSDIDGTVISKHLYFGNGRARTFSQEVRLTGNAADNRLNYILGANYQRDNIRDGVFINLVNNSGFPPDSIVDSNFAPKNRSIGVFGNLDFDITPELTFTTGVRYTDVKQSTTGCTTGNANTAGLFGFIAGLLGGPGVVAGYQPGVCINIDDTGPTPTYAATSTDRRQSENNVSWRVGLNYKPTTDSLLYALVSRGYKAGLFPVQGAVFESQQEPVVQERLTSYEVGAKGSLLDRRLQVSASAFYYQYVDKQFNTFLQTPIGVVNAIVNIPKSSVKGIDLDVTAIPVDGLTIRGAMTYVKTRIGSFSSFDNGGVLVDYTGTEFNFAPKLSGTLDAEYRTDVGGGLEALASVGLLHNSRTFADLGEVPSTRMPAFTVFNARVGLESDKGWNLALWVRNLTNEYYWNSVGPGGDTQFRYAGLPRTFGISAGVKF
jgi:iron complex outermembrane receptor protein